MRSLTTSFLEAINPQETDTVIAPLLKLSHSSWSSDIMVVRNEEDVVFEGNIYTAFPFNIELLSDKEDEPPKGRVTLDNVSRLIIDEIRSIVTPPSVKITIARLESVDTHAFQSNAFQNNALQTQSTRAFQSDAFQNNAFQTQITQQLTALEEFSLEGVELGDVDVNALTISGSISLRSYLQEPAPYLTFTPVSFPGLF